MFLILLSFCILNLPKINNIYKTTIKIPLIGKQNIKYKRIEKYKSSLNLNGIININGYIYFDENNINNYSYDKNINKIITKYKCNIKETYYNYIDDLIIFKLKINLLNIEREVILKNEKN